MFAVFRGVCSAAVFEFCAKGVAMDGFVCSAGSDGRDTSISTRGFL